MHRDVPDSLECIEMSHPSRVIAICMHGSLSLSSSIYPLYLSIYLSIDLSLYLSIIIIDLFVSSIFMYLSISLSIYLFLVSG